jgi:type II restriction/modification system DNA methylase subunit YeeA
LWESEGISWTKISSRGPTFRWFGNGMIAETGGPAVFAKETEDCDLIWQGIGFLSSNVSWIILTAINPTLNFQTNDILNLPFNITETKTVIKIIKELSQISKDDWNEKETSIYFTKFPLIRLNYTKRFIKDVYRELCFHWQANVDRALLLKEENNRIFTNAYKLHDEVPPEISTDEVTLYCNPQYRYGNDKTKEELESVLLMDTIKELISYAIGCMMGRYSLDHPGLIYALSGNHDFDSSKYKSFPADDDGIIPIMDMDWFEDDATKRFIEFIKTAWPKEHLDENLKFVTDSLNPKTNESPEDTIRRYLSTTFFKDHMKMYKKRPIYWLFSSGKQKAFECLVYLHRYNESTLSRMRSNYVTPLQGNISARIEFLDHEKNAATTASAQKKSQKQIDVLKKKQVELKSFDDELRHYADMKISLDLDDGVKVNYGKFGNLLAEKKAITGKA